MRPWTQGSGGRGTHVRGAAVLALLLWMGPGGCSPGDGDSFDVLIRGGEVVDGSGGARYRADVGIRGDEIVALGDLSDADAARVIDADGRLVAPGFIDLHAHVADGRWGGTGLLSDDARRRAAQNYVAQGVTTVLGNPDGNQPPSLEAQRTRLAELGIGVNLALTNGHNGLREIVMGDDQARPATGEEIVRMREILEDDLAHGRSFGLSLGTEYFSGLHSTAEEQVELARPLPEHDGIFIPHMRSQGIAPMWYRPSVHRDAPPPTLDDAIEEVLRVAEETGARVVFTHMKAWGPGYRGHADEIVARLQAARDRGLDVYMDVYPYESSGSDGDFVAIPDWAFGEAEREEGFDHAAAFAATLAAADEARRTDLEMDIRHQIALKGGVENIVVLDHPEPSWVGMRLSEIMETRGLDEVELILALQEEGNPLRPGGAHLRSLSMSESDIATFYAQPWTATSTDGWIVLPEEAVGPLKYVNTHRRAFGSFPQRIAHFSGALGVDSAEEAIRSMTRLPADILGLRDRGRIEPGMKADVVVVDLEALRDRTTYLEPSVYPAGIDYVLVNGVFVVDGGERTLALPGRVLGRPGPAASDGP